MAGGADFTFVCLCVCLFFPHDISKTDVARIAKLNAENAPARVPEIRLLLVQKNKGQGYESQKHYRRAAWVFALL